MNYLGMYILTKLDSWHSFTGGCGWVLLVASRNYVAWMCDGLWRPRRLVRGEYKKLLETIYVKTVFVSGVVLLALSQLLPTTKQAAFIYIAPQIIENGAVKDTVKNIPELTKLGTDYLKELLKEKINEQ